MIAQGLSAFAPNEAALAAVEIMMRRIRKLAALHKSFAFETTLAGRSLVSWLGELKRNGYRVHLVFMWLPSADMAVQRVASRVRMDGHDVPEETIRRRYARGLQNFFRLYRPLATTWRLYDNSHGRHPKLVASGAASGATRVSDRRIWDATASRTS